MNTLLPVVSLSQFSEVSSTAEVVGNNKDVPRKMLRNRSMVDVIVVVEQ